MKKSRQNTLFISLASGVVYFLFIYFFIQGLFYYWDSKSFLGLVSATFIFIVPLVLGFIPVLLSTRQQLKSYLTYILFPWGITLASFLLSFASGFEGAICLVVIALPFLILGSIGGFIARLIKLKKKGNGVPLYTSLFIPFIFLGIETNLKPNDQFRRVETTIEIAANKARIWESIKNVKDIQSDEIKPHFVHMIGVPKPLNSELNKAGVGGIRHVTWEKGIHFEEIIKTWDEGNGFTYDIHVDPNSIPQSTLDDHVKVGGRYFDVTEGSYLIERVDDETYRVKLSCTYRVTTNFNAYSELWADFILDDFNKMILEVIKTRSETEKN